MPNFAIRIITATRFSCTRCGYSKTLREGQNVPAQCPACELGPKSWYPRENEKEV